MLAFNYDNIANQESILNKERQRSSITSIYIIYIDHNNMIIVLAASYHNICSYHFGLNMMTMLIDGNIGAAVKYLPDWCDIV